MKRWIRGLVPFLLVIVLLLPLAGCGSGQEAPRIITVQRSQYSEFVTSDGNLEMPHEVRLKFQTPGMVKDIYVQKGDTVKAGKLLAKLDDSLQRIALTNAQYDVELALNNLAEKIYPSLIGYPHFYPSYTSVISLEGAQKEVDAALAQMSRGDYASASAELRVALHDLTQSRDMLSEALIYVEDYPEEAKYYVSEPVYQANGYSKQAYPAIPNAITQLDHDLAALAGIQKLLDEGSYAAAREDLISFKYNLVLTHNLVKSASGSVVKSGLQYPDTSTSLSVMQQVWESLNEVQRLLTDENADPADIAEQLRISLNDMETGRAILSDNELLIKAGLNMQTLRAYNLNYQKALQALEKSKKDLLDTEILAPFDGTVTSVGVKESDLLSIYDYSAIVAFHLVDTGFVEMSGVIDEIDIFRVHVGQNAYISLDALPGEELEGTVSFISPYSSQVAGIVNYPVSIKLNETDMELRAGLTATARILVESKPETISVPRSAVLFEGGNQFVQVVLDEVKMELEKRQVNLGKTGTLNLEIVSGLSEGEKILANPLAGR